MHTHIPHSVPWMQTRTPRAHSHPQPHSSHFHAHTHARTHTHNHTPATSTHTHTCALTPTTTLQPLPRTHRRAHSHPQPHSSHFHALSRARTHTHPGLQPLVQHVPVGAVWALGLVERHETAAGRGALQVRDHLLTRRVRPAGSGVQSASFRVPVPQSENILFCRAFEPCPRALELFRVRNKY